MLKMLKIEEHAKEQDTPENQVPITSNLSFIKEWNEDWDITRRHLMS